MAINAQVQYIRYAVDGSAARKVEAAPVHHRAAALPKQRTHKRKCIYIDPVAIFGIAVALCMFVMLSVGLVQYGQQHKRVERMQAYVDQLRMENDAMESDYIESYDAQEVERTAMALGMVHKGQSEVMTLQVTPPQQETKTVTLMDRIGTFLTSLFA